MKVYLVQHAKSKSEEEDPTRPLSDEGRNDLEKIVKFLDIKVSKILHSGKLRAKQTAEIFSKSLNAEVQNVDALEPLADPTIWAEKLDKETNDVMIVGHLPHLEKLASLLLCKDSARKVITFKQGGVVCLEKTEGWAVAWMVVPDLLR